jgi:hypothetical protein
MRAPGLLEMRRGTRGPGQNVSVGVEPPRPIHPRSAALRELYLGVGFLGAKPPLTVAPGPRSPRRAAPAHRAGVVRRPRQGRHRELCRADGPDRLATLPHQQAERRTPRHSWNRVGLGDLFATTGRGVQPDSLGARRRPSNGHSDRRQDARPHVACRACRILQVAQTGNDPAGCLPMADQRWRRRGIPVLSNRHRPPHPNDEALRPPRRSRRRHHRSVLPLRALGADYRDTCDVPARPTSWYQRQSWSLRKRSNSPRQPDLLGIPAAAALSRCFSESGSSFRPVAMNRWRVTAIQLTVTPR